ncbi:pyridoxamine 5'-phosphate oxidase family protein [Clostridium paraputrificum]|uniref:pyridoxamine 5'-phosphate oxidase family protein n=1 Tax=Clostridium paraputrificum TaxID=29363 RepID=UPI003D33323A
MSDILREEIKDYIKTSRSLVLATVNSDQKPIVRTIGGFAFEKGKIYFLTAIGSNKVEEIKNNNNVGILFQHENQELSKFKNIFLEGRAERVEEKDNFKESLEFITNRREKIKITDESHVIYEVVPKKVRVLDFSKENLGQRVEVLSLD